MQEDALADVNKDEGVQDNNEQGSNKRCANNSVQPVNVLDRVVGIAIEQVFDKGQREPVHFEGGAGIDNGGGEGAVRVEHKLSDEHRV